VSAIALFGGMNLRSQFFDVWLNAIALFLGGEFAIAVFSAWLGAIQYNYKNNVKKLTDAI
jgi:hypothetical protein